MCQIVLLLPGKVKHAKVQERLRRWRRAVRERCVVGASTGGVVSWGIGKTPEPLLHANRSVPHANESGAVFGEGVDEAGLTWTSLAEGNL